MPAIRVRDAMNEEGPRPARVVLFDIDGPMPTLDGDERYRRAFVVGTRDGVPVGTVEVTLGREDQTPEEQLSVWLREAQARQSAKQLEIPDSALPSITVVVPTIAVRLEEIELLLSSFDDVNYPDVEFILADNRREVPQMDPLAALVRGRERLRIVRAAQPGGSAARNAGLAAAKGDIVAFTDDDVRVDRNWLLALGRRFAAEPQLDAVTGLILPAELETPAQIWFEQYYGGFAGERTFDRVSIRSASSRSGILRGSRVETVDPGGHVLRRFAVYGIGAYGAGAHMAFRRKALQRIGGFDPALGPGTLARGGEDLAAFITILWNGGSIGYEPASFVFHRHRRTTDELLRQLHDYGLGFTATVSSLIVHDQRHLVGLASQITLAVRAIAVQNVARIRHGGAGGNEHSSVRNGERYPSELVRREMAGFPKGPLAYYRSRRATSAWTHPQRVMQGTDT